MGTDISKVKAPISSNPNFNSERFENASDDFTLSKEDLQRHFKCKDKELETIFEHFDMDGNGKIDSYEFICALTMLSHSSLEEKAELIFNLYDFDGSKYISRDELVILMTNSLTALNSMAKKPPPSIEDIEKKTDDFFQKADTDGDKKITLQEFKIMITHDPELLKVLLNFEIAKKEDLGTDFGTGEDGVPLMDKDLENECYPKSLDRSDKKTNMKDGVDFHVKESTNKNGDSVFEEADMGEGDQFMAVKPWKGTVDHMVPSNYKPSKNDGRAPDATLELEHIYGYRCHDSRNNLRYTATGQIVYHAAAVGVVLNKETNTQKFLIEHNDDIQCLALDPSGKFAATGQIGPKPWLFVWDTTTMQCVARITGTLLKGIKQVCFSSDGKFIAASALDDDHCIAIYEWQKPLKAGMTIKPTATGKGTKAAILSLGFNPQGNLLVATAVKEVCFFTVDGTNIKCQKGIWGQGNAQEAVLCQAFIDQTLFTGLNSGAITPWNGRNMGKKQICHKAGVQSLFCRKSGKGLISGGNDGLIIVWGFANGTLTQEKQFDLKAPELKSLNPQARSVCDNQQGLVLVGSRGGEIYELGGQKPSILMRSHCQDELWGLAPNPKTNEFITVGQDSMLAIWDTSTRKQKKFARLDCTANVLTFSSDASILVIGYTNGQITALDPNFQVKALRKDRTLAIQEIKFSPDNGICAVGAHDSMIFTYDAKQNFKPLKKLRGNSAAIMHFDFTLDGRFLMTNSKSYEILFYDVAAGKQNASGASALKDTAWNTWTCTLGWPVQGIFPPCADGSDVNSCDRSPDGNVLATADDFGTVKLFRYPCPVEEAAYNKYAGHSSHVTNVRFIPKANYLISTGGEDKCIFQWKYHFDKESHVEGVKNQHIEPDTKHFQADIGGQFQEEEMGEGDQRLAVVPFLGEVENSVPSDYVPSQNEGQVPDGSLRLKYAHGFRSFDTRGNLKYSANGDVVFTTAALGVALNARENTQTFFNQHQDDVVSLAMHPNKDIFATGQMAAKGKAKLIDLCIWKSSTMESLATLTGFHRGAIRNLAFSPSGDKLLSLGEDENHSAAIYDWANKKLLSSCKIDQSKIFDAVWKNETEFVCVGMKCVYFLTINGQNITKVRGIYDKVSPGAMMCANYVFQEQICVSGNQKGELVVWNGKNATKAMPGHTDVLWSILCVQNNSTIITGANDAVLLFWDNSFKITKKIEMGKLNISKFSCGVRSLDYNEKAKTMLVGTRSAEIVEIDANKGQYLRTLIRGHFEGTAQAELWGCATHPNQQLFATCGADSTLRIWSENKMIAVSDQFKNDITAVDWSSNGAFLIVGDRNGYIYSVDANSLTQMGGMHKSTLADKKEVWIEDVKIAPSCQMVVYGTHGGLSRLELVKIIDNGKKLQTIQQINTACSSALYHFDWDINSQIVVLNSQAQELMWFNAQEGNIKDKDRRIFASSAKDTDYHTWTCLYGFHVQGIWSTPEYFYVNSTCRSNGRTAVATGDDGGAVKLFRYPCVQPKSAFKQFMGHSSHVTKVKFSAEDTFVISTGGNDKTVLVWETDFSFQHDDPQGEDVQQLDDQYEEEDGFDENKYDQAKVNRQQEKDQMQQQREQERQQQNEGGDDTYEVQDAGQGDEFMAVKPWLGQIKEPTNFKRAPPNQMNAPQCNFDLEWVHGYRAYDCKNNVAFVQDGHVCYHAAGLGIVLDSKENVQHYFKSHIDDVTAIAFSSNKQTIATGELGPKPSIYVWDSHSMQMLHQFKNKLTKGINCMAFSPSGKLLGAAAMDDGHQVAVYNVESGQLVATNAGDKSLIIELAFRNETEFTTVGVNLFKVWTISPNAIKPARGTFGKFDPRIGSIKYNGDTGLTGSITGELYMWQGTAVKTSKKLHEKPIDAVHCSPQFIFTGGRDFKVNVLSASNYQPIWSFAINTQEFGAVLPNVRALCINEQYNQLLIGTVSSDLYQVPIDIKQKTIGQPKILVQGHYSPCKKDTNEVWGLAVFKGKDQFVTVSDDATMRVWDTKQKKMTHLVRLDIDKDGNPYPVDPKTQELAAGVRGRSLCISPDGKYCAIGFRDGQFRFYETASWTMKAKKKLRNSWIQDIKFSPDGKHLAVCSHDAYVDVYDIPGLTSKTLEKASSSAVTHIDWSLDSKSVHTNDRSYEVLYYDIASGKQNKSGATAFRDETWATYTIPLGWPSLGIWPGDFDGSDINAVDRSNQPRIDGQFLIASADNKGKVNVFKYPSIAEGSKCLVGTGHSSHVTMVKFSPDDLHLYSTGGNDTCVFQWKLSYH